MENIKLQINEIILYAYFLHHVIYFHNALHNYLREQFLFFIFYFFSSVC